MGEVLENGVYLPDEGERNAYNGLKGNWNTVDTVVAQVQALSSTGLIRKPVDELPTEDIETNVIYMLKATKPNGDVYRIEYMYIDNHWDALGTSETTLDDYYTKAETDNLPAVKSGINATRVSNYDAHLANNDIHVTLANKQTWDGKQNALDTNQTAAVNSGVTGTKVTGYDTHVSDTDIHVTASDKAAWNGKQDGLSQTQLAAVNSGITSAKVTGYDSHIADTDVHVTTADKAAWNGKQNALTQTQLDNIAAVPDKANSADLATVATTGDYGDLLNAPTIPTVNNAALTIQKNGTDVATFTANASSNVTANLAIPVNTSDLNNDAGFLTQHNPVDNELSATSENALQNKVVKSELDGKAPLVHTHAASDVTSGTFNIARIPNLDASKITSGTIDIARLPKGSLERLIKVANQAARYALTTDDVQLGDTVQQLDTGVMYVVTDETKLDSADGYTEFTAGSASSVPWTGVTGKPADYTPASHSHGNITNDGKVGTTANLPLITGTGGAVQAGSFGNQANTFCEGNDSRLSDARTPVAHTHGKADITDLLNSNFIPSANNSYDLGSSSYQWNNVYAKGYYYNGTQWGLDQANTWTGDNVYSGDSLPTLKFKNTSLDISSLPASNLGIHIDYLDKNNVVVSGWNYIKGPDGTTRAYIELATKNSNNQEIRRSLRFDTDQNGTNWRFYPSADINLGIASNQWKSVYAQSYYYNGTAWGLDKANTWTDTQTYSAGSYGQKILLKNTGLDLSVNGNTGLSSTYQHFINWVDKNNTMYSSIQSWASDANTTLVLRSNYRTDANTSRNLSVRFVNTATDKSIYSETNADTNLGTSTSKWKTLNGVNPGALSLPATATTDASGDIVPPSGESSINLSGNANTYTPSNNGWLTLAINCASGSCIIVRQKTSNRETLNYMQGYVPGQTNIYLTVPVLAGVTYYVFLSATSFVMARFALCQGNV